MADFVHCSGITIGFLSLGSWAYHNVFAPLGLFSGKGLQVLWKGISQIPSFGLSALQATWKMTASTYNSLKEEIFRLIAWAQELFVRP